MTIINLVENTVFKPGLRSEHGLSIYIEHKDKKILFDSGQSGILIHNAERLKIDLSDVDYLVLSHGHYDHTGGVRDFLKINSKARIVMKKEALYHKLKIDTDNSQKFIGFNYRDFEEELNNQSIFIEGMTELEPGIWINGNIVQKDCLSSVFYVQSGNNVLPDLFDDELWMTLEENNQFFLFTGCSHHGIIPILNSYRDNFENSALEMLIGGFHLSGEKDPMIQNIALRIKKEFQIGSIYTCHCTGLHAYSLLSQNLNQVHYFSTGDVIHNNSIPVNSEPFQS